MRMVESVLAEVYESDWSLWDVPRSDRLWDYRPETVAVVSTSVTLPPVEQPVDPTRLREFIGFIWQDDFSDRTGVLVVAADVSDAAAVVRAAYGDGVRVSLWNEEDAARPR